MVRPAVLYTQVDGPLGTRMKEAGLAGHGTQLEPQSRNTHV